MENKVNREVYHVNALMLRRILTFTAFAFLVMGVSYSMLPNGLDTTKHFRDGLLVVHQRELETREILNKSPSLLDDEDATIPIAMTSPVASETELKKNTRTESESPIISDDVLDHHRTSSSDHHHLPFHLSENVMPSAAAETQIISGIATEMLSSSDEPPVKPVVA